LRENKPLGGAFGPGWAAREEQLRRLFLPACLKAQARGASAAEVVAAFASAFGRVYV
jgi:hypothetical protein